MIKEFKPYTARSFRKKRKDLGFSADQMGRLCGCSSGRVIRKWEAGDNGIPEGISRFLWALDMLKSADRDRVIDILLGV